MKIHVSSISEYNDHATDLSTKGYQEEMQFRQSRIPGTGWFEYRTNVFSKKATKLELVKKITKSILLILISLGSIFVSSTFRLSLIQAFRGKKIVIIESKLMCDRVARQILNFNPVSSTASENRENSNVNPVNSIASENFQSRPIDNRNTTENNQTSIRKIKTGRVSDDVSEILNTQGIFILKEYVKNNRLISLNGVDYNISYRTDSLTIKNNLDSIVIPFKSNSQDPLKDCEINLKETPDVNGIPLRDIICSVYKLTSNYSFHSFHSFNNEVRISLVKNGLLVCPDYHLTNLALMLKKHPNATIRLTFLDDDLKQNVGVDREGLKKDYFNDLMKGLMSSNVASFKKGADENLLLPQAKEELKNVEFDEFGQPILSVHQIATLSDEEKNFYENLGSMLIYAFKHNINLGRYLDNSLFKMIFSLSSHHFNDLENIYKIMDLCQIYAEDVKKSGYSDLLVKILDNLNKDSWTDDECIIFASIADAVGIVHPKYQTDGFYDDEKINTDGETFIIEMLPLLMNCLFKISIRDVKLGNLIQPTFAIASGMYKAATANFLNWDRSLKSRAMHFQEIVQGSLDRKAIASCFRILNSQLGFYHNDLYVDIKWDEQQTLDPHVQEIKKKVNWIRDWITKDATDQEIRDFLKYVTGTSSLGKDVVIKFRSQHIRSDGTFSPAPLAHSCFNQIDVSPVPCGVVSTDYNDHTKENFIAILKEHCLKNADYQFA